MTKSPKPQPTVRSGAQRRQGADPTIRPPLPEVAIGIVRSYAQQLANFGSRAPVIATTLTQLVADIEDGIVLESLSHKERSNLRHCIKMLKTLSRAYRRSISELLADAHVPDRIVRDLRSHENTEGK